MCRDTKCTRRPDVKTDTSLLSFDEPLTDKFAPKRVKSKEKIRRPMSYTRSGKYFPIKKYSNVEKKTPKAEKRSNVKITASRQKI